MAGKYESQITAQIIYGRESARWRVESLRQGKSRLQEDQENNPGGQLGPARAFVGLLVASGGSGEHGLASDQDGRPQKGI